MRTSTEKSAGTTLGKVTFNHFFENVRDALLRGGRMTKYKGIVASYAPSLGKILDLPSLAGFGALSRGGTAALLLAAAPVTLTGTTALAGVCGPVFPGLYTCAFGENDGVDVTQSLLSAGGGLTVTTTLGFGIDTTTNGGTAIELATVAPHVGLVFNDGYAANITGAVSGIAAYNISGAGDTYVYTRGVTRGLSGNGIVAADNVNGGDVTVIGGQVYGYGIGDAAVYGVNNGAGNLSITADNVVALFGDGIEAQNYGEGDLTITVENGNGVVNSVISGGSDGIDAFNQGGNLTATIMGNVHGYARGIDADNQGDGDLYIHAYNDVTGLSSDGIRATNGATAGSLTILADGAVYGGDEGIQATNDGSGLLSITATDVEGLGGDGIRATGGANGTGVSVTANNVSGGDDGIQAENFGTGDIVIQTSGDVSGATSDGIRAETGAAAANVTINADGAVSGDDDGIYVDNNGTGSVSITTLAAVSGANGNGIYAENSGTSILINASGTVTGDEYGIYVANNGSGSVSIMTLAAVTGTSDSGIYVENSGTDVLIGASGTVTGDDYGIYVDNNGSGFVAITTSAAVTGTNDDGIYVENSGTNVAIVASGTVTGDDTGIYVDNNGSGDVVVTSTEAVTGTTDYGIYVENSGANVTINASGAVSGFDEGIFVSNNGSGFVNITSAAVTSADDSGIYVENAGTDVTINANGAVTGNDDGINADNNGSGGLVITTAAAVVGTNNDGINARNSGTVLSIDANADVTGGDDGIDAVNEAGSTSMLVTTMAVTGNDDGIYASNFGSGDMTITADGAVEGTTGDGIDAYNDGGNMFVTVNDTVLGANYGITATNSGSGFVRVTTSAGNLVEGTNEDGIHVENRTGATSVEVIANGAVLGGDQGIFVDNQGTAGVSVSIFDDVTGNGDQGVYIYNSANDLTTSTYFYQAAASTLSGATDGLYINNGGGSVTVNALGEITGLGGDGVEVWQQANGDVSVSSNIVTGTENGIYVNNDGTGDVEVITNGLTTGGAGFDGIYVDDIGGDVDVTTNAAVTGGNYGIKVQNRGAGDATITTNDTVNGDAQDGIFVWNDNTAGGVTVTAGVDALDTVTGGDDGIYVDNNGTGAVFVVANGAVTGTAGYGIYVANSGTSITIDANAFVDGDADGIYAVNESTATTTSITITTEAVTGGVGGIQADNNGTGVLDIQTNGVIIGEFEDGIQAENDGTDLTILTMAAVSGQIDGIDATNTAGTQALSITTNGTVDGTTGDGINADNWGTSLAINTYDAVTGGDDGISAINQVSGTTTTLTIDTVAVTGGDDGIYARNNGSGALDITTYGAISGTASRGILARNQGTSLTIDANDSVTGGTYGILAANLATATTTDVTITTMAVTGGSADGINAYNGGSGVLDITTAGIVTGGDDGIDAENQGTDLTIDAQMAVTGVDDGIIAENNGTGVVDITTAGVVTGTNGNGIEAYNDGTSITIDAQAAVTGGVYGVLAVNNASGTTTDITIDTVAVTGGTTGVGSVNYGSGVTKITTIGDVEGTAAVGIGAIDFAGSGDIIVDAQGNVTGGNYGIFVSNYGGAVNLTTAAGFVVDGQTDDGIHVYNGVDGTPGNPTTSVTVTNNGAVHGGDQGIYIHNLGTAGVTVNANANVIGDGDQGLYIYNSAYDVSASVVVTQLAGTTINGATDGAYVNNFGGSITMTMLGSVNGFAGDGIDARNNIGTTFMDITAYSVYGTQNGINASNLGTGFQTITTNAGGTVTGVAGAGIAAINGAASTGNQTIDVNGDVNGGSFGVFAQNYGAADQVITSAAGTTISSVGIGIGASNSTSGVNQTVTTNGDVYGANIGIGTYNYGTGSTAITTNGAVDSANIAIAAVNSGTTTQMDVTTNGAVTGGYAGVIAANAGGGDLTVTTNSTVAGGTYAGVVGIAYGPNAQNVVITTNDAVTAGYAGVVGVQAANGTLDITTNGTVDGGAGVGVTAAAYGPNATDIAVVTNGTVNGDYAGVAAINYGTDETSITTNAAVTSANGVGVVGVNGVAAGDLLIDTNQTVTAGDSGVVGVQNGTGALSIATNEAVIGTVGNGIYGYSTSTAGFEIVATAAVTGGNNGIYASVEYAETMNITVSSAITGGTGAGIETESYNAAAADYLGNAVVTLNNGATVSATSGDAIINDGGDSDTYANAGALIVGNVYLGDGNDNLTFTSSSINSVGILDGGDDVSSADGMVDILSIDNVFGTLTGGDTINWEEIRIGAFSTVNFDDAAMTAGLVVVEGFGNLDFGNAFALTGDMQIDAGGDLFASGSGAGLYSVSGDLTNNGRIEMRDSGAGDRLAVGGDFTSTTGILNGDVDFSFGTDAVDGLDIAGDVNLGNTNVFLRDLELGFASGNDILFAGVGGTSFGTFTLTNGPITTGIWDYDMEQIGQDWWLTGDINATGAVYEATPAHLLQFANLPTMQQRIGRRATGGNGAGMSSQNVDMSTQGYGGGATGPQAWARVIGSKVETGPTVSTALITDQDHSQWGIEAGIDISTDAPGLSFGILAQAGGVSTMVTNPIGFGTMDSRGFGVGATATWVNADGLYVDAQARATWIKSDLWSTTHGQLMTDYDSSTYALSVEAGKRIELGGGGTLIPQAQLTWGQSVGGAFIDNVANVVDLGTNTSLIGRIGLAYEFDNQDGHSFYAIGNILRDFSDPTVVDANSTILNNAGPTTWLEVGLGGSYSMSDTTSVYGEITYQTELGGGGSMGYGASAGISIQW